MVLSDKDIFAMLRQGELRIRPLSKDQVGAGSVDLTLSDEWWVFKRRFRGRLVDLSEVDFKSATEKKVSEAMILEPGEMCLGKTVEKLTLPPYLMGSLEGRSRYARMGLAIHITSALVQPGSDNRQVLEIVNFAPFPVKLNAGMRISQVVFERLETPTAKPYSRFGKIARKQ